MAEKSPIPVRFPEELLSRMEQAYSLEGMDRSSFIRYCVEYTLAKNDAVPPLPEVLVNQCEYLYQVVTTSDYKYNFFQKEVERLWNIINRITNEVS